jgi:NAD(P)-dependent dehydrogenase (short-subunit alcohol dehydrogenase family)
LADLTRLEGKLAVVTGSSRGIGLAVAQRFAAGGAHVVRLARSLREATTAEFTDAPCDVADEAAVRAVLERVVEERGTPDILVNNAGAFVLKPLVETTGDELAGQLAVNVSGPFHVIRTLLPHFLRHGRGHIVTIGSVADYLPLPGNAAYAASKFGLRGLHEVVAAELAGTGIHTTLISPGPTDTSLWDSLHPDDRADLPNRVQMQAADDVAEAVVFAVTRSSRTNIDLIRMMPA